MKTLTIRLRPGLHEALAAASARAQVSKSELVRRALMAHLERAAERGLSEKPLSALALAGDLVGCFSGGPTDLASNARYLEGFGQR
jgi:Ribbon-helix-helix protein, copG family